ncbi:hypothetical protein Tco_0419352 [Tanacetum coccineum]
MPLFRHHPLHDMVPGPEEPDQCTTISPDYVHVQSMLMIESPGEDDDEEPMRDPIDNPADRGETEMTMRRMKDD